MKVIIKKRERKHNLLKLDSIASGHSWLIKASRREWSQRAYS